MKLAAQNDQWLGAMLVVARHYGIAVSEENVRVTLAWEQGAPLEVILEHMARQLGLAIRWDTRSVTKLDPWQLPLIVELNTGEVGVVQTSDGQGRVSVMMSSDMGLERAESLQDLSAQVRRVAILRPQTAVPDARVDDYIKPYRKDWFWAIALKDWRRYGDVMLASLFANLLALAGMIFSMQIYDRVIPAQSESTLWVLFSGVMIAIIFEFSLRVARGHISDVVGKRADLKISDVVFGHALRIRNDARPKSTGSFIAQVREIDQLRELLTSTTIGALADLPFFLLFLVVLWLIGGSLVFVALAAVPLLVIPGLLIQRPLARLSSEGMREAALRNAMLVEAVQGHEDIKLLRAEQRFQNQWNNVNDVSARISKRQRFLTNLLMTWTQEVQSIVYALTLLVGVFLVIKGDLTTGALVGSSILASRMISPLSQLSGIFARWQQAKVAREGLDMLMKRPVDQPEYSQLAHRSFLHGDYELEGVSFQYGKEDKRAAISVPRLQIKSGEKIAILGRMGAGKSTLLQLLAGLQAPQSGRLTLDGLAMSTLDPADLRRDMSLLTQNSRLFHGSIRDNILMGAPLANDDEVLAALSMAGAESFVRSRPEGLDDPILEGGLGLSGGQRQALLLARTLIRQSSIVLLDEPTNGFDEATEQHVIKEVGAWLAPRSLVVVTHRMSILKWVNRVIVVDNGRIVMDGPKDQVIGALSK